MTRQTLPDNGEYNSLRRKKTTSKMKKQKEGKKKMRTLGTVQLPTEAFMAVLKLDEE